MSVSLDDLHLSAAWRWYDAPPTQCPRCEARLVPYVPHCLSCHAPIEAQMEELRWQPRDLAKRPGTTRIAHLSDLHIGYPRATGPKPMTLFRLWLARLAKIEVDLLIISGDLVERPGDRFGLEQARAALDACGMPWLVVPGNHDLKRPGHFDVFNEIFGLYPRVETRAGVDLILLDSMAGLPLEEREVAERLYGDYVCYTEGRIGQAQLDAVDALLPQDSDRPRHLILHHHIARQHADLMPHTPRQAGITEDVLGTMRALMDVDALMSWARARHVRVIYHGHKHLFQQPGMRPGAVLVLQGGSSTLRPGHQHARLLDLSLDTGAHLLFNLTLRV